MTGATGHAQIVQLWIRGANGDMSELAPLTPPAAAYDRWPDSSVVRNVARLYAMIAQDSVWARARRPASVIPWRSMRQSMQSSAPPLNQHSANFYKH